MIIVIGSEKGGTGKTTIATNIAAIRANDSKEVMLLDTDFQKSATAWGRARAKRNTEPLLYQMEKTGLVNAVVKKIAGQFDDIIIDTAGSDSEELRSSLLVADVFYIPIQPSTFDVWTISTMVGIINEVKGFNPKLKAYILLNRASPNPSVNEPKDAEDVLKDLRGIKLSKAVIRDRITFRKAARDGLAVTEMKPADKKAVDEIQLLYKEIYND